MSIGTNASDFNAFTLRDHPPVEKGRFEGSKRSRRDYLRRNTRFIKGAKSFVRLPPSPKRSSGGFHFSQAKRLGPYAPIVTRLKSLTVIPFCFESSSLAMVSDESFTNS